jgi:hypothetical protein
MHIKKICRHSGQNEPMMTNSALRRSGRRELDQPSSPVRLEQRLCSASHDTKVRQAPGLHLFGVPSMGVTWR